jgi:hypothetical protein
MIVARHEVPGFMRKIARPSGTVERISVLIGRQHTFQQEYLGFLKRHELRRAVACSCRGPVSTTNFSGTGKDSAVPLGGRGSLDRYPGTSCLATISLSLRDERHWPIPGLASS